MDTLIGSWLGQVDELIVRIFDGSEDSINKLTGLLSDGKMITNGATSDGVHTASRNREKNIERAFYAAAIPAAWTANRPAPVVVDFGASCEIDARGYFTEEPDVYNVGWRCPNGHSYILAGVRDGPQDLCGENHSGDGGVCVPVHQWTFDILSGIGKLKDDTNQWGGVTVDDLIIGAVNTYEKNGKKNIMDTTIGAPNTWDKTITEQYQAARVDIRTGGLIRIPVCTAEVAKKNLAKGRAAYGESPNYPCDP